MLLLLVILLLLLLGNLGLLRVRQLAARLILRLLLGGYGPLVHRSIWHLWLQVMFTGRDGLLSA